VIGRQHRRQRHALLRAPGGGRPGLGELGLGGHPVLDQRGEEGPQVVLADREHLALQLLTGQQPVQRHLDEEGRDHAAGEHGDALLDARVQVDRHGRTLPYLS
jgi:hypothetical protein